MNLRRGSPLQAGSGIHQGQAAGAMHGARQGVLWACRASHLAGRYRHEAGRSRRSPVSVAIDTMSG